MLSQLHIGSQGQNNTLTMAPSTKVTKIAKNGGKDIRMFFSGTSSGSQKQLPVPVERESSASVSEPDDDDELLPRKGQTKGKSAVKKPRPSATKIKEEGEKETPHVNDKGQLKEEPPKKYKFVSLSSYLPALMLFH